MAISNTNSLKLLYAYIFDNDKYTGWPLVFDKISSSFSDFLPGFLKYMFIESIFSLKLSLS